MPDVGFISKQRQTTTPSETYIPQHPDLAVEVKSPTDVERLMTIKVSNYLAVGTVVWVVYPEEQEIHIHQAGHSVNIYTRDSTLTDDSLLTGFTLTLATVFAD